MYSPPTLIAVLRSREEHMFRTSRSLFRIIKKTTIWMAFASMVLGAAPGCAGSAENSASVSPRTAAAERQLLGLWRVTALSCPNRQIVRADKTLIEAIRFAMHGHATRYEGTTAIKWFYTASPQYLTFDSAVTSGLTNAGGGKNGLKIMRAMIQLESASKTPYRLTAQRLVMRLASDCSLRFQRRKTLQS